MPPGEQTFGNARGGFGLLGGGVFRDDLTLGLREWITASTTVRKGTGTIWLGSLSGVPDPDPPGFRFGDDLGWLI